MDKLLVLNSGSSTLKYKLFSFYDLEVITSGTIEIAQSSDYLEALKEVEKQLKQFGVGSFRDLKGVGHRVVHGGEKFTQSSLIDQTVIEAIQELIPLAPLHNGANLQGILEVQKIAPDLNQVAVFDTAFHQTMPIEAYLYPLPYEWYEKYHIRRYGFHGTSHHYVAKEAAKILDKDLQQLNLITIHLGNGDSVCAIKNGRSIDTSMGFTPLEGLMMGTRSGDIDPAIVFYLMDNKHYTVKELEGILNKQSGLLGICGESDMRKIEEMSQGENQKANLAKKMFSYHVKKYIGSYLAILGRVDALIFTGGIGENDVAIREMILEDLHLDIPILVIKTDEEKEIAQETKAILD